MKSYLINLDRSEKRLEAFARQASAIGFAFERISAVDGKLLGPDDLKTILARGFQFQPITANEAAVFLSHRTCWQKLIDSEETFAAIFEDDAVLAKSLPDILEQIELCKTAFDLIKLETTGRRIALQTEPHIRLLHLTCSKLCSWHGGAAGYVISRQAAAKLLERTEVLADPVDQVLFHPLSTRAADLNILQAVPAPVIQYELLYRSTSKENMVTTIGRKQEKKTLFRHGLWIDIRRAWQKHMERRRRRLKGHAPGHVLKSITYLDDVEPIR